MRNMREHAKQLKSAGEVFGRICRLKKDETISLDAKLDKLSAFLYGSPIVKENTKEYIEKYCLIFYLSALSQMKLLSSPEKLQFSESPDFILYLEESAIGLEVTKATTTSFQHACDIAQKSFFEGTLIELNYYGDNETNRIIAEKGIRKPDECLQGSGFGDYGQEKLWIKCIKQAIEEKTAKLNKLHFRKFNSNELIIFDGTPTAWPRLEYAIPRVKQTYWEQIAKDNPYRTQFDKVHVKTSEWFIYDLLGIAQKLKPNLSRRR